MVFAACVRASTPAVRVLKLKLVSHALRKLNFNVLIEGNELARTPLRVFGEVVCKFLANGNKDKRLEIEGPLDSRGLLNKIK